jgi:hypothetical protein
MVALIQVDVCCYGDMGGVVCDSRVCGKAVPTAAEWITHLRLQPFFWRPSVGFILQTVNAILSCYWRQSQPLPLRFSLELLTMPSVPGGPQARISFGTCARLRPYCSPIRH